MSDIAVYLSAETHAAYSHHGKVLCNSVSAQWFTILQRLNQANGSRHNAINIGSSSTVPFKDFLYGKPPYFRRHMACCALWINIVCFTALQSELDLSSPLTYGTPSSRVEGTPRSGIRGTPARQRPDLGSARKLKQVDLQSDQVGSVNVGCGLVF